MGFISNKGCVYIKPVFQCFSLFVNKGFGSVVKNNQSLPKSTYMSKLNNALISVAECLQILLTTESKRSYRVLKCNPSGC